VPEKRPDLLPVGRDDDNRAGKCRDKRLKNQASGAGVQIRNPYLERLTGRDRGEWREGDYREPDTRPSDDTGAPASRSGLG
jgi:hypothetical protein